MADHREDRSIWRRGVDWLTGPLRSRSKSASTVSINPLSYPAWSEPEWATGGNGTSGLAQDMSDSLVAYACCVLIGNCVSSVRLVVRDAHGELRTHHPILDLLARPTPDHGYVEWAAMRTYHMLLTGADYLEVHGKKFRSADGETFWPRELWPYPEGIYQTVTADPYGGPPRIVGYKRYGVPVKNNPVIRSRFVSPGDWKKGLGPRQAANTDILADRDAARWQRQSYVNRLMPGGVFTVPASSDEEIARAEAYIDQAWARARNAHKPIVIGGGVQESPGGPIRGSASMAFERIQQSAVEADFVNSRYATKSLACNAFGVPEVIFSSTDSTFANLDTARRLLWENTIIPLVNIQLDSVNHHMSPWFAEMSRGPITVEADLSSVPGMLPALEYKATVGKKLTDLGMPMKQVNERLGMGLGRGWVGWDRSLVGPGGVRFHQQDTELEHAQSEADVELTEALAELTETQAALAELEAAMSALAPLPEETVSDDTEDDGARRPAPFLEERP